MSRDNDYDYSWFSLDGIDRGDLFNPEDNSFPLEAYQDGLSGVHPPLTEVDDGSNSNEYSSPGSTGLLFPVTEGFRSPFIREESYRRSLNESLSSYEDSSSSPFQSSHHHSNPRYSPASPSSCSGHEVQDRRNELMLPGEDCLYMSSPCHDRDFSITNFGGLSLAASSQNSDPSDQTYPVAGPSSTATSSTAPWGHEYSQIYYQGAAANSEYGQILYQGTAATSEEGPAIARSAQMNVRRRRNDRIAPSVSERPSISTTVQRGEDGRMEEQKIIDEVMKIILQRQGKVKREQKPKNKLPVPDYNNLSEEEKKVRGLHLNNQCQKDRNTRRKEENAAIERVAVILERRCNENRRRKGDSTKQVEILQLALKELLRRK